MGIGARFGQGGRIAVLLAVGAVGGAAAIAIASVPGGTGVITACLAVQTAYPTKTTPIVEPAVTDGNLRVIDPSDGLASQSCNTASNTVPGISDIETQITWNDTGPQGPPGLTGPQGAVGTTATVADGSTLTLPNREVITVGGALLPTVTTHARSLGTFAFKLPAKRGGRVGASTSLLGTIDSYSFGVGNPTSSSGNANGKGKAKGGTLVITTSSQKATPELLAAMFDQEVLKTATIKLATPGSGKPETVVLGHVLITALESSPPGGSTRGTSEHDTPLGEDFSFTFTSISVENLAANCGPLNPSNPTCPDDVTTTG